MEKKTNKGLICLVVVLLIALLGTVGYILVDKGVIKLKKEKSVIEKNKNEGLSLEIDNAGIVDLYNKVNVYYGNQIYMINNSANKKIVSNKMSYEDKMILLNHQLIREIRTSVVADGETRESISEVRLKSLYEDMYGTGTYEHKDEIYIDLVFAGASMITNGYESSSNVNSFEFKYDASTKEYNGIIGGVGGTSGPDIEEGIESAKKYDNSIEIITYAGFLESTSEGKYAIYASIEDRNKKSSEVATIEGTNLSEEVKKYSDKLSHYRYTFKADKAGFYRFESMEKVK